MLYRLLAIRLAIEYPLPFDTITILRQSNISMYIVTTGCYNVFGHKNCMDFLKIKLTWLLLGFVKINLNDLL